MRNLGGEFKTKTGRERQVPLHGRLMDWMQGIKVGESNEHIIHPEKKQGKSWLRWDPRVPFSQLTKDCGLQWVTFHTMRHTFGSLHAIAGTAEIKIRRWMGITPATWERHYAGLCPDDRAIDRI